MQARIQLVAIVGSVLLLLTILEMVRRRRLMERYALLWLLSGIVLLGLGIWRGALAQLSHAVGISYPPNALFFVGFGFVLLLLLHFSAVISRLSDQTKVLAQRQAVVEEKVQSQEQLIAELEAAGLAERQPDLGRVRPD